MRKDTSKTVTSVISRSIRPGYEKDYDDWVQRYLELERKAPGYLGTTIILPGGITPMYGILFAVLLTKPQCRYGIILKNPKNY